MWIFNKEWDSGPRRPVASVFKSFKHNYERPDNVGLYMTDSLFLTHLMVSQNFRHTDVMSPSSCLYVNTMSLHDDLNAGKGLFELQGLKFWWRNTESIIHFFIYCPNNCRVAPWKSDIQIISQRPFSGLIFIRIFFQCAVDTLGMFWSPDINAEYVLLTLMPRLGTDSCWRDAAAQRRRDSAL